MYISIIKIITENMSWLEKGLLYVGDNVEWATGGAILTAGILTSTV